MEYSIYVTDSQDKIVFDQGINQKKGEIINHMVQKKKTMMIYHGLFVNLVAVQDIS